MSAAHWVLPVCLLTCCLHRYVSADSQQIKVKPGDEVLLHCQSPGDAPILMFRWIRSDLVGSVYYFRDNRTYEDFQHESLYGRVELRDPEMKDGDVSVNLKNVNMNDTGTYECRVGHGEKPELINTINLRVEPGNNKDGGDKDEGDKHRRHNGLSAGLTVVLLLVAFGFLGFMIYKKFLVERFKDSFHSSVENYNNSMV